MSEKKTFPQIGDRVVLSDEKSPVMKIIHVWVGSNEKGQVPMATCFWEDREKGRKPLPRAQDVPVSRLKLWELKAV